MISLHWLIYYLRLIKSWRWFEHPLGGVFFYARNMHPCDILPEIPRAYTGGMYKNKNLNPSGRRTTDCVIRAIAMTCGADWGTIYDELARAGKSVSDMMDANHVWIRWLERHGFTLHAIPDRCPDCYTVRRFCADHPEGTFVLGTGDHAIAVIDGDWYDTFDSGDMVPIFYLRRRYDGL